MINQPIIHEEVIKGISMLKNNKASVNDKIHNEYINNTQNCLLNLYTGLFNKIFDTGVIQNNGLVETKSQFIKTKVLELNLRTIDPLLYQVVWENFLLLLHVSIIDYIFMQIAYN